MRIFICSTCFDLIDLRAELEEFFRATGANPALSDSPTSDFEVLPDQNSIETCLANVRSCDQFIIILSQRYGPTLSRAGFGDVSATHLEYREAVKQGKSIRMYVRDRLEGDYATWKNNPQKADLQLSWCKDEKDWKIFELLQEHRGLVERKAPNNWLWTFRNSIELIVSRTESKDRSISNGPGGLGTNLNYKPPSPIRFPRAIASRIVVN